MPHSPAPHPCQEENQRPQSAHPSLAPQSPYQGEMNHLTPSYQNEVRRSSLSGPCQMNLPISPQQPQYLSPNPYRNNDSYGEHSQHHQNNKSSGSMGNQQSEQGEHSSEVWQDIVRQLAVS